MSDLIRMSFAELEAEALALPAKVRADAHGSRDERIRYVYELICEEIESGAMSAHDDLEIGHAWDAHVLHF